MAKYTVELYKLINEWGYDIWDFTWSIPNLTSDQITQLKDLFVDKYYFREIGLETPDLFLKYFQNKWNLLCYKYNILFGIYNENFTGDDLYSNNTVKSKSEAKFLDTPQSEIQMPTETDPGYLTNLTRAEGNSTGLTGKSKYEIQRDYADKMRFIMYEMIDECEPLFIQLLD